MKRDSRKLDSQNNQDLDWLAFCYIADELDESANAEFEARLENDELAQRSVADAVAQSRLIYCSLNDVRFEPRESTQVTAQTAVVGRNSLRRARFLLSTAAALALLVAGWGWYSSQDRSGAIASTDSERLADAWVATLVAMNDDDPDVLLEEETQLIEFTDDVSENWMFVALTDLEGSNEGPD